MILKYAFKKNKMYYFEFIQKFGSLFNTQMCDLSYVYFNITLLCHNSWNVFNNFEHKIKNLVFMKKIVEKISAILLMGISVAFVSCGNNQAAISAEKYKELLNESILLIPDSLLNEEQAALKTKLVDLVYEEVEVVDNNLVLKMSREALEQQGIPSFYYDILQYQMKETTDTMKKWVEDGTLPVEHANLDSLFRKSKEQYLNGYK